MTNNHFILVKIQPIFAERDADGYWFHPDIPDGDDSESLAAFQGKRS